jgi:multiple sugar transport system substrate-binding protein
MMRKLSYKNFVAAIFFYGFLTPVSAEKITVGVLTSSGIQRSMYTAFAKDFEAANPSIEVEVLFRSDSEYKTDLVKWFAKGSGPDILNWQGGERLYQYVRDGYVKDISDFWQQNNLEDVFSDGAKGAISYDGKRFAIPISYYQWGFYYRESLFQKHNLSPPNTWQEFLDVCAALKAAGITPITIGAEFKWPTAAWFDYINLRINGLTFHQSLLKGEIPYTDPRVREVFVIWKNLLDQDFFVDRYNGWNWQEAMPFMYHKLAGMTLIGNFFAGAMPSAIRDDFRFFRFPIIDRQMDLYEEAPLDLFMVPSYARKTPAMDKFLLFLASKPFQQDFNEKLGMISPNVSSESSSDYFIKEGSRILNASAGVSQFFDRDANADMAGAATEIFTVFMDNRDISSALDELEQARKKYMP